jgi:hypothetical protein
MIPVVWSKTGKARHPLADPPVRREEVDDWLRSVTSKSR